MGSPRGEQSITYGAIHLPSKRPDVAKMDRGELPQLSRTYDADNADCSERDNIFEQRLQKFAFKQHRLDFRRAAVRDHEARDSFPVVIVGLE